jgi:alkylated DNA nucleotide flippase Atl1
MDLTRSEDDLFAGYVADFAALAGDARTRRLVGETLRGIIGAESLCCARIAAFSPGVGRHPAR